MRGAVLAGLLLLVWPPSAGWRCAGLGQWWRCRTARIVATEEPQASGAHRVVRVYSLCKVAFLRGVLLSYKFFAPLSNIRHVAQPYSNAIAVYRQTLL
jgi:hypothetical protein